MPGQQEVRVARWYFGGFAGCGAVCVTHPLDLLKVHLQTQSEGKPKGLIQMTMHIIKKDGVLAMYSGLSAALLRQMTYTMTRFGVYEILRGQLVEPGDIPGFGTKVLIGGLSGLCGGLAGTPADMVNVRMQNDIKLPLEQRRNYKHALDGLYRVYRQEGISNVFRGGGTATIRGGLMNIGQLSFYEQAKQVLIDSGLFMDNLITHFTASVIAGAFATLLTQPIDVLKTRMMNAKPGEFKSIIHCATVTARGGPMAFFKGTVPAFIRLAPHTILLFVFFEQLRMHFGAIQIK
uniref:Mitochondrial dicarboxylate carrier n=1 Tax=Strigamia maritima TaxID=126957 RepID=T1J1X7_STRMM